MPMFTPAYLHYLAVMAGRAAVIFLYLILLFRLLGKRQLGQLNIFDLAAIMGVANAVQNGVTMGSGNLSVGLTAALLLLVICRAFAYLFVRFRTVERVMVGSPTVLVTRGEVQAPNMRRYMITPAQLEAAIHMHGLQNVEQVKLAVLELDGSISIVPNG